MEVRRTNIIEEVSNILETRITQKNYKAGECLPSQSKLASELRVSRNSIREAINRLTIKGLIKPVQGVGTIVLNNRSDLMLHQALKQFNLSYKGASTILEIRMVVERAIVRLAALRARKSDLANLERNLAKQKDFLLKGNRERFAETDVAFHLSLAKASRNKLLLEIEEANIIEFRKLVLGVMQLPITMKTAFTRHTKIMEGIRLRDPIKADREMAAHLRNTIAHLTESTAIREAKEALLN